MSTDSADNAPPRRSTTETGETGSLRQFAIKAGIVVAGLLIVITYVDSLIGARIASASKLGGRNFWTKVEGQIERLAQRDLPPEKKEKLLSDIRVIVDRWRPFVVEVLKVAAEDPQKSAIR